MLIKSHSDYKDFGVVFCPLRILSSPPLGCTGAKVEAPGGRKVTGGGQGPRGSPVWLGGWQLGCVMMETIHEPPF